MIGEKNRKQMLEDYKAQLKLVIGPTIALSPTDKSYRMGQRSILKSIIADLIIYGED